MPGNPPLKTDFPASITLSVVPSPNDKPPANVLIMLHSLGDTNDSFAALAAQMNFPETTAISVQAPRYMPFSLPGFQWGEDVVFSSAGELSFDAKFENAGFKTLKGVVEEILVNKLGWKRREIFFFGWGQGAMCALDFVVNRQRQLLETGEKNVEFGGVVSVGGPLPSCTTIPDPKMKCKTPVLLLGGNAKSLVTREAEDKAKRYFDNVEVVRWKREGDGMFKNEQEVRPMMEFFGRRLLSRAGVPEGVHELSG